MYLNKTYVLGNLTRDPEMKALPNGGNVTTFGVATNRFYKDQAGMKQEATEYHNIVVFGRQAELCNQYLKRGQSVLIEGRLQTRNWDDQATGTKKYRTEIVAESIQFGPKGQGAVSSTSESQQSATNNESLENIDYGEGVDPDDIPF